MDTSAADTIIAALKETVEDIAPDLRFVVKYGGEVMCPEQSSDTYFVGGIFIYKDHVSLEFSEGVSLIDPSGHLEGKGKLRRHLKLKSVEDVSAKDTRGFLQQTLS